MKGHIFRRNGGWAARFDAGYDENGERIQKYASARTQPELKAKIVEVLGSFANGTYIEEERTKVKEYAERWLKLREGEVAPKTYESYEVTIRSHINPFLGRMLISKVMPIYVQEFIKDERAKYSSRTVQNTYRVLSMIMKHAMDNRLISRNPCDPIKVPKCEKKTLSLITEGDYGKLLKSVQGTVHEVIIMLAGGAGLRRGEILALTWKDVDFKAKTLSVNKQSIALSGKVLTSAPKTKSSVRKFELPDAVMEVLQRYKKIQSEKKLRYGSYYQKGDLICCNDDGSPLYPTSYSQTYNDLLSRAGIPPSRLHDLRHFNATMMLKYGVSAKVAAERLGHASLYMTQEVYQHALKEMDTDAAKKLEILFNKR